MARWGGSGWGVGTERWTGGEDARKEDWTTGDKLHLPGRFGLDTIILLVRVIFTRARRSGSHTDPHPTHPAQRNGRTPRRPAHAPARALDPAPARNVSCIAGR